MDQEVRGQRRFLELQGEDLHPLPLAPGYVRTQQMMRCFRDMGRVVSRCCLGTTCVCWTWQRDENGSRSRPLDRSIHRSCPLSIARLLFCQCRHPCPRGLGGFVSLLGCQVLRHVVGSLPLLSVPQKDHRLSPDSSLKPRTPTRTRARTRTRLTSRQMVLDSISSSRPTEARVPAAIAKPWTHRIHPYLVQTTRRPVQAPAAGGEGVASPGVALLPR